MSETPYTEIVTPEELSGEHIGLMARAQSTRDRSTYTSEGPITDIAFSTNGAMVRKTDSKIRVNGATVKIGNEWWALEFVRFQYDAAAIRIRRNWHIQLPDGHVDRVHEWKAKHAQAGEEAETVTIPRDTYNTLVATYKTYQQIEQAIGTMGETPKLRPEDVEELDQH